MRIKGLDNGYLYTKDDERRIFKSAFSKEVTAMTGNSYITIDGITYCVGTGNMTVDTNKVESEMNMVGTLMNLAMTGPDDYCLVVGLPISQYKELKDELKLQIMSYNMCQVRYKDRDFKFSIKDVLVFPQGAAALLQEENLTDGDFIVLDIGGLTIDAAYIEIVNGSPVMHKNNTWFAGVQKLYSKIIYEVNTRFNMSLEISYAEKILRNGLRVDGVKQDIAFLENVKEDYLQNIIKELKLNYPSRTTPIYICGGGGIIMKDILGKEFKDIHLIPDSQFANARGYYKIGLKKFKKYLIQSNNVLSWRIPNNA